MYRSQYDSDTTTWSPQGRLIQVEYATEAVKQGSISLGLRNENEVVLVALKRSPGKLASYQKKILPVDKHIGVAIAGLTSDARVLNSFMRSEALTERLTFGRSISLYRLSHAVADKMQGNTQYYGGRPYGVGLLLGGVDETGPHLYECSPSGHVYEFYGMAIGARSQPARTYLEKEAEAFKVCDKDELIYHGLAALQDSLVQDMSLTSMNVSVCLIQRSLGLHVLTEEELEPYLAILEERRPRLVVRDILMQTSDSGERGGDGNDGSGNGDGGDGSGGNGDGGGGAETEPHSSVTPPMSSMEVD